MGKPETFAQQDLADLVYAQAARIERLMWIAGVLRVGRFDSGDAKAREAMRQFDAILDSPLEQSTPEQKT
jgi:hypothetical protein